MAEAIKKLKVGLIGCGRVSVMHLVSIAALKETELVACCDIKKERADETAKKYAAKAYYSYEEMLDSENLDAVHICLPHYLHSKVACYAFEKGVHVLTEKPMDVDLQSAENAVAKAKATMAQAMLSSLFIKIECYAFCDYLSKSNKYSLNRTLYVDNICIWGYFMNLKI
mgnify:CR=1 FL=1